MEPHSHSLHDSHPQFTVQVVETTFGIASPAMPGMNFRQCRKVTKRGVHREKTTRTLIEVLLVSVAAICLFLTGCARTMTENADGSAANPILINGGEATLPPPPLSLTAPSDKPRPSDIVQPEKPDTSATDNETSPAKLKALKETVADPRVQARVRVVMDWLEFLNQQHTLAIVRASWARLQTGKVVGPLHFEPVADFPEISIRELMLWRQMLLTDKVPLTDDMGPRFEVLAIALTLADRPDDLLHADRNFPAGYGN